MIIKPSLREIAELLRTKMNGKIPKVKVIIKLIINATWAPSLFTRDTNNDRNINNALTRRAKPTFLLIAL